MKVLIITYYWVPAGGSGVQRWLKFVKYLRDFGIEPIVFTVENPNYPITDSSLANEIPNNISVVKNPIWEPNHLLSIFKKEKTKTSAGFLNPNPRIIEKSLQYIRANYFIPDARMFWIQPSVKKLKQYLSSHKIDAIISTGPPHSMHLIGLHLKKELGIKWIADFRDPWTDIDYFHQLPLTQRAKEKHLTLEKEVLKQADATIVVGKTMKRNYLKFTDNIHVITNGFDTESTNEKRSTPSKNFTLTHIGLMNADRNPKMLWEVLNELSTEITEFDNDLEIKLIGSIADEVTKNIQAYAFKNTTHISYVPHSEVKKHQQEAQVLLLAVNNVPSAKGIITGKIFEYLQAKRPILAIGPEEGDLAEILLRTNAGTIVDFNNKSKLKEVILHLYQQYKNNNNEVNSKHIQKYHRKELTQQLANLIKETINS